MVTFVSQPLHPASADFDLVVIGSGPAGEKGATQAAYFGHRVAIVERRPEPGGAAVAVSGIPVKALRDTAMYLSGWTRRDVYGVAISLSPDLIVDRLRARTAAVVSMMSEAVRANLERHGIELVPGTAKLGLERTVMVQMPDGDERVLRGRVVLLATGSRPFHPPGIPFEDPDVYDSEGILSIGRIPVHLLVVGAGAVGCEYASIFAALGAHVTIADRGDRLLPLLDVEVSGELRASLERASVRVLLGSRIEGIERDANGLAVRMGEEVLRPDVLLHAAGRAGNVEGLGLEEAGVQFDRRGYVNVDPVFRTTAEGIYAAGDVAGLPGLASVAMEQARVAMCHAFDIPFKEAVDPLAPIGIFSLPEIAMVGLTEEQARKEGEDVETGRTRFEANARAKIAGATEGLLKLVFRREDRRLLGVHILGEEATELVHIGQSVLHEGATIDRFIDMTFNFPTRAEAYKYAAYDGLQRLSGRVRA